MSEQFFKTRGAWEEFQSFSKSGLNYTVQELAFLLETLKEFTGKKTVWAKVVWGGNPPLSGKSNLINANLFMATIAIPTFVSVFCFSPDSVVRAARLASFFSKTWILLYGKRRPPAVACSPTLNPSHSRR